MTESKNERWALTMNPLQLQQIKVMRLFLLSIGVWPDERFGRRLSIPGNIQRKTLAMQVFLIVLGSCYYLILNRDRINFFVIGHVLIATFLSLLMIVRILLPHFKEYGHIIHDFIMEFHLIHHKHKGQHYKQVYEFTHKASHYFSIYQLAVMIIGCCLFCLTPLYNDYSLGRFNSPPPANVSYDYAIFFAYPGYNQDEHFYISTLITIYCSYNCSICICMMDLLLTLMLFQIIGHIKIQLLDMENMTRPNVVVEVTTGFHVVSSDAKVFVEKYSAAENADVHRKLVEMTHHHRLIAGFADRVSDFFGPMLAFNFLFHLIGCCILLLECSSKDTKELARFGPLTLAIFGQLIQLCTVFEYVGYMSEKLVDSVYCMPWECMDVPNQRCVQILLHRYQTPIQLTAMGMVPVGVQTMQAILKSTLSFFAFLQTLS